MILNILSHSSTDFGTKQRCFSHFMYLSASVLCGSYRVASETVTLSEIKRNEDLQDFFGTLNKVNLPDTYVERPRNNMMFLMSWTEEIDLRINIVENQRTYYEKSNAWWKNAGSFTLSRVLGDVVTFSIVVSIHRVQHRCYKYEETVVNYENLF